MQLAYTILTGFFLIWAAGCQQVSDHDTETAVVTDKEQQAENYHDQAMEFNTKSNKFFLKAKEAYRQGDLSKTAANIREGGEAWYQETPRIDTLETSRKDMLEKIRQLAEQTRAGEAFSIEYLNDLFSEAEVLGARMELENSIRFLQENDTDSAMMQSKNALNRIDEMLTYTERTIDRNTRKLLDQTRQVLEQSAYDEKGDMEGLSLKLDSVQVALHTMTKPADIVRDVDTAYVVPN